MQDWIIVQILQANVAACLITDGTEISSGKCNAEIMSWQKRLRRHETISSDQHAVRSVPFVITIRKFCSHINGQFTDKVNKR